MPFAGYWLMRSVYVFQPEYGCDDDGRIAHLALRRASPLDRRPISGNQLLSVAEHGALQGGERYQPYYQVLLGCLDVGAVYLADAPHRLDVCQ